MAVLVQLRKYQFIVHSYFELATFGGDQGNTIDLRLKFLKKLRR